MNAKASSCYFAWLFRRELAHSAWVNATKNWMSEVECLLIRRDCRIGRVMLKKNLVQHRQELSKYIVYTLEARLGGGLLCVVSVGLLCD